MSLPHTPAGWAIHITKLLQAVEEGTGQSLYPVNVKAIAPELSRSLFPDAPLTYITGADLGRGFEGMLVRVPQTANDWGIVYNTASTSTGRINFTLAHEFGHYLLHRQEVQGDRLECRRQDVLTWQSEEGQREAEANEFASTLLMPRNSFEAFLAGQDITLHRLQQAAEIFEVSLTAAILRWLHLTPKRAMLLMGDNGFVKWVWSSDPLRQSGVYLRPKQDLIELPAHSLAVRRDATIDSLTGITHKAGAWPPFNEDLREMTLHVDAYEATITLLLFPDDPPQRWREADEESELMDTFERFMER